MTGIQIVSLQLYSGAAKALIAHNILADAEQRTVDTDLPSSARSLLDIVRLAQRCSIRGIHLCYCYLIDQ